MSEKFPQQNTSPEISNSERFHEIENKIKNPEATELSSSDIDFYNSQLENSSSKSTGKKNNQQEISRKIPIKKKEVITHNIDNMNTSPKKPKNIVGLEGLGQALDEKGIELPETNIQQKESQKFKSVGAQQIMDIPRARSLDDMATTLVSNVTGISEKELTQDVKKQELLEKQNEARKVIRKWTGKRKGESYNKALKEREKAEKDFSRFGTEIKNLNKESSFDNTESNAETQKNLNKDRESLLDELTNKNREIIDAKKQNLEKNHQEQPSSKDERENLVEKMKRKLGQQIEELDNTTNKQLSVGAENISEVQSILKSLDQMKSDPFATPSMIMREKRKMRDLIRDGKVDSLEAELLMQDSKKTKIDKKLGLFAGRIAEKNREFKKENWFYRNIISVPEYDKKWKRFAHRAAKTTLIGAGAGLLGMTGVGFIAAGSAGAAYSLGRLGASAGAGFLAGEAHRKLTKKELQNDRMRYKEQHASERLEKKQRRLSAEELQQLRTLRQSGVKEKRELNKSEQENLISLEKRYETYSASMLRSLDNYNELLIRREARNNKNRGKWAAAAGLLVGLGSAYGIPRAEVMDLIDDSEGGWKPVPDLPKKEDIVIPTPETISDLAKVREGDGISQIIKRQFDANPELAKKFGITTGSPEEYKNLMERMGYKQGNSEVWLKGGDMHIGKDAYVPGINADGDPVIYEFKNGQTKPFEHQCFDSGFEGGKTFDNDYIDPNEYLKDTTRSIENNSIHEKVIQESSHQRVNYYDPRVEDSYISTHQKIPTETSSHQRIEAQPYEHGGVIDSGVEAQENAPRSYDPRGKSNPEIRKDLREMYRNDEITKKEHRLLKRELLRDGRTWGRKNAWMGAVAALGAADLIEDGKFDAFGIFDKKGNIPNIPESVPEPVDEDWNPNNSGQNSGGSWGGNGSGQG
jgi:hypothetical protein